MASTRAICAPARRSRSLSARAPSRAAAACCWGKRLPSGLPKCAPCPLASISAVPAAIPIGPVQTITIKIQELREATDWQKPVFVKIGSARPRYDVQLAVKAGADVIVLDAG